jgi:nucleoside phosphorylase
MEEEIVMTPSKHGNTTSIRIEKVAKSQIDQTKVAHKAGGQHSGLVVNKQGADVAKEASPPQLQLEFKCYLIDHKTNKHIPESRVLKFWFSPDTEYFDRVTCAYEFFKELVRPENFPRDYVGFIKKVMKQMQSPQYFPMKKMEIDLRPLDEEEEQKANEAMEMEKPANKPRELVVQEQLLLTLESAYPNILPTDDLAQLLNTDEQTIREQLRILTGRNLIKEMEPGKWVRQVMDQKTEVKIVKQMPTQTQGRKPTVAIITSKYYEKLAVDSMMEDKTTFVRYKGEGESNVYTIGNIGPHRVVSTKLPQIGRQMAAQISSGNTTTRLLGTFGDVEHVLLVGVCGAVPHYTDYYNHVRLGDIIVSMPNKKGQLYIYCDKIQQDTQRGQIQYALKSWAASDSLLRTLAESLYEKAQSETATQSWERYIHDGQQLLEGQQVSFDRPRPETDRLFMNIGGDDVIEMQHPAVPKDAPGYRPGIPTIRLGAIASGKPIVKEDQMRLEFAGRHQCVGIDTEFDQVLESIVGNRKESFIFVRGACDYLDGTKNVVWQPYSALVAAAFMKALIEKIPTVSAD